MTMSYLEYPKRAYGNDHDLYAWSYSAQREPVRLDDGTKLDAFIVVPLEFFPLNPSGKPFKHPGAMVTPYPDLRHYTTRDYGLRVGVFRILKALRAEGLKAVFPVNAVLLDRVKPLIETILADGHEIAAHGVSTDHIHYAGLSEADEEAYIVETKALFEKHCLSPKVWMSPARNESYNTPELLAKHGFTTLLDWEMDQRPIEMKTTAGSLTCLPHHFELNDFNLLITKRQSEDEWEAEISEAARYLLAEYDRFGSQVFGFTLTPYVSGLPFRIHALKGILKVLAGLEGVRVSTASEISANWSK